MAVTDGFGFPVSTDESGLGTKFWHKGNIHVELVLLALRLEHEFGIKHPVACSPNLQICTVYVHLVIHHNLQLECLLSRIWKCLHLTLKADWSVSYIYIYICTVFSYSLIVLILKSQLPVTTNSHWFLKWRNRRFHGLQTLWLGVTSPCSPLNAGVQIPSPISGERPEPWEGKFSPCLLDIVLNGMNHLM